MKQLKTYPTIAVCGLDCGLCPRYYTVGPSRCPGCGGPSFSEKHPSCSFITCAVKKRALEVCGECADFPCSKFKGLEESHDVPESSSYPPRARMLPNLRFIRDKGIKEFMRQQRARIGLLEAMIERYDDGRSRSFFCRAAALLEPSLVKDCLKRAGKAIAAGGAAAAGAAGRAGVLRSMLEEVAAAEGIELRVKRPSS